MYGRCIKRLLDVFFAVVGLVLLSPVLLAVAVLVAARLGRPVIFRQVRPGKDGRLFRICKFRTMTDERDAEGALLPDEVRLTPFGRRLRSTSLDELPELWNILKGDMSVVGPRPLLVDYLPRYNAFQARRHEVRPGLTGLAQVNGATPSPGRRNSPTMWLMRTMFRSCWIAVSWPRRFARCSRGRG